MQVPAETIVIVGPFGPTAGAPVVQTAGVLEDSVTANPELAVARELNGVVLKFCAPGLLNVIVCGAAATVIANACAKLPLALVAVTVKLNVPVAVGVPASTPPEVSVARPVGIVPAVTLYVGVGDPFATKVWEYAVPTVPAGGAALVKLVGACASDIVKLGAMVVVVAPPQPAPGAATVSMPESPANPIT